MWSSCGPEVLNWAKPGLWHRRGPDVNRITAGVVRGRCGPKVGENVGLVDLKMSFGTKKAADVGSRLGQTVVAVCKKADGRKISQSFFENGFLITVVTRGEKLV